MLFKPEVNIAKPVSSSLGNVCEEQITFLLFVKLTAVENLDSGRVFTVNISCSKIISCNKSGGLRGECCSDVKRYSVGEGNITIPRSSVPQSCLMSPTLSHYEQGKNSSTVWYQNPYGFLGVCPSL